MHAVAHVARPRAWPGAGKRLQLTSGGIELAYFAGEIDQRQGQGIIDWKRTLKFVKWSACRWGCFLPILIFGC